MSAGWLALAAALIAAPEPPVRPEGLDPALDGLLRDVRSLRGEAAAAPDGASTPDTPRPVPKPLPDAASGPSVGGTAPARAAGEPPEEAAPVAPPSRGAAGAEDPSAALPDGSPPAAPGSSGSDPGVRGTDPADAAAEPRAPSDLGQQPTGPDAPDAAPVPARKGEATEGRTPLPRAIAPVPPPAPQQREGAGQGNATEDPVPVAGVPSHDPSQGGPERSAAGTSGSAPGAEPNRALTEGPPGPAADGSAAARPDVAETAGVAGGQEAVRQGSTPAARGVDAAAADGKPDTSGALPTAPVVGASPVAEEGEAGAEGGSAAPGVPAATPLPPARPKARKARAPSASPPIPEGMERTVAGTASPGGAAGQRRPGRQIICRDPRLSGTPVPQIVHARWPCGIAEPVRLNAIAGIGLSTPVTLDCNTASRLASWLTGVADRAAVQHLGTKIEKLWVMGSYACRTRNGVRGGKLSEHARGRAVDIGGVWLADGRRIAVEDGWGEGAEGRFLAQAHGRACGLFHTVLGPKADRHHEDHFHFDTSPRGGEPYCR